MLKKLEREGYIKKLPKSDQQVQESLKLAERDLETAIIMLNQNYDWAFNIAYNSILQSTRALMYNKGYRASSQNSHVATLKFAKIYLDESDILYFDRMRRKRHQAVYDIAGTISLNEAKNAILRAEKITNEVKEIIDVKP
ncbi:HEPN domain-containing protein [Sediminibacterium sp.]|uniref:HEPN domain-containing protein n=1 Tax=Sediminibacterium sp. TaxID=1917865 RepID=UPI002735480F|nr:HEPN domain-containing protein [Sediminibacterium sp.]MDP3566398.1 HEPN domain-containing protein [Sediminibacterium sp.]